MEAANRGYVLGERFFRFRNSTTKGTSAGTIFTSIILDPTHPQLLERLADDAPDIWQLLRGQSLSAVGRKNLLRFLGSGYGSSERYALVLRHQHEIARSLQLFESSEYLVEILGRYPEEIETLAEVNSTAPVVSRGGLFDLLPPLLADDRFASGD